MRRIATVLFVVASVMCASTHSQAQVETNPSRYFKLSLEANNAGMQQLVLGNYVEAERLVQTALDLLRQIPKTPVPANYASDFAAWQRAVDRVRFEGVYAHNLGQVFFRQGKYKEAEPLYKTSIAASESDPSEPSELKVRLADLETLYVAMGELRTAKEIRSRIQALGTKH